MPGDWLRSRERRTFETHLERGFVHQLSLLGNCPELIMILTKCVVPCQRGVPEVPDGGVETGSGQSYWSQTL